MGSEISLISKSKQLTGINKQLLVLGHNISRIIFFALWGIPCFGWGQAALSISADEMDEGIHLQQVGEFAADHSGAHWLEAESLAFQPLAELRFPSEKNPFSIFTNTANVYWVRFRLENTSSDSVYGTLKVGVFDSLSLFKVGVDTPLFVAGLLADVSQADFPNLQYLKTKYGLPIQLEAGETATFYLRIKNNFRFEEETASLMLYAANQDYIIQARQMFPFLLFNGLFFGVLLFLLLFFGVQFFQNKDKAYGYYLLYLISTFAYFWWKFEKANSLVNVLASFHPEWHYFYEVPISIGIYFSYTFFVIHFMDVKKQNRRIYHFIKKGILVIAIYLLVNYLISFLIGFYASGLLHSIVRLIVLVPIIYVGYHLFRLNKRLFAYILLGTSTLILGSIVTVTLSANLLTHYVGPWDVPLIPLKIGVMVEILFFSLGLGYKSRVMQKEKKEAHEKIIEQELRALRSQLNPHFIFNCLMAIKNLIGRGENDLAEKYLVTFSRVMRSSLNYSKVESVTLADEIAISQNYIQMEALRFQDQFTFHFDLDKEVNLTEVLVPPLILQPYLENAIKHGLLPKTGQKLLRVRVKKEEKEIHCTIDDNGVGRKSHTPSSTNGFSGDGTRISAQRLLLFNQKFNQYLSIQILDKKDAATQKPLGTQILLKIPIQ